MKKSVVERLFSKADPETESGCWEWIGRIQPNGYGQIHHQGKTAYVHRVAWELTNGKSAEGFDVCHSCDNRRCVNPSHLFLGSRKDNMEDAVQKGRQARGTGNGRHKIDEATVLAIRAADGNNAKTAKEHGVSRSLVSFIRARKIWRHI